MNAISPWPSRPLGELTENFDAIRVPVREADRRAGPYPYYGASGIVDHVDGYLFDGEYLLIAEDGENLRTRQTPIAFLARGKFWVNNHAHVVRGNELAETRYLAYALGAVDVGAYLTGSTQPKLTQAHLNRIPVPAPPRDLQTAIADVLGALDDKIDLNRRMNETLEALAQVAFEDVAPDEVAATVGDVVTLSRASIVPMESLEERFDHYSIPAFDEAAMPANDLGSEIKSSKVLVPPDAVLISKLNPRFPRVWLPAVSSGPRSVCSTEFLVARPRPPFTREYVFCFFRSTGFQEVFRTLVTGTSGSHQRVKAEHMLAIPAAIPSAPAIEAFTATATPLLERVALNRRESRTLAQLRDALLPKLISGEIRVATT
ncbi:MAG: restriction endonuclease subunit S [Gaiellales bacterium]